jgi:hypothetical protein
MRNSLLGVKTIAIILVTIRLLLYVTCLNCFLSLCVAGFKEALGLVHDHRRPCLAPEAEFRIYSDT